MFVDRHNNDHIRVAPCCQSSTSLEPSAGFNFNTSIHLTQLREKFNSGERPVECNRCWQAEDLGHKSRRQSAIEFFQLPANDCSTVLQSIDYNATWACNLACIMCGPEYSSGWAKQENLTKSELKVIGRHFRNKNNFLDCVDLTDIKKIHFNGGEPLLNDDHTDMLFELERQGVLENIFISYNTNGTVMPNKKTIDLWSKTRLVKIFFSVDAVGSAFEYVRWPANWGQTSKNISNMKQLLPGNVMLGLNLTVGSYNLLEIDDVWSWFNQTISTNKEGDKSDFCWQFADNFDVKFLPHQIKIEAIRRIESIEMLGGIVAYLKTTLDHEENYTWLHKLIKLDSVRDTNWKTSLRIAKFIKKDDLW
jgi:hypothetical protein